MSADTDRRRTAGTASTSTASTVLGAVLLLAAGVATLADASARLRAPLWLLSALVVAAALAGARRSSAERRPRVDAALVGIAGVVMALVASGFLLDAVGVRLARDPWAVVMAAAGIVALVVVRLRAGRGTGHSAQPGARPGTEHPVPRRSRAGLVATAIWSALALVIVGGSFAVAVTGADDARVPPVELSVRDLRATSVDLVVDAPGDAGPYEIRTDGGVSSTLSYPPVTVTGGEPVTTTVLLPPEGKVTVSIYNIGQSKPFRSVVVNR